MLTGYSAQYPQQQTCFRSFNLKAKVLNVAVRMANEALEATKGVSRAAAELEILHHGSAS